MKIFNSFKKENFRKIKKPALMTAILCFTLILFSAESAKAAGASDTIATILGWIAALFTSVIGWILTFLIKIMVNVANYNDIISVDAVVKGWVIVRDLCNMFFILILLVIAFATILRQENYAAKRLLPKLLIMAIVINFSKTIFGLIIDFSQVIMMTFVAGLGGVAEANFVAIFQVDKMSKLADTAAGNNQAATGWAVSAGIIAGVFAMIITLVVVVVLLTVLIMRVIMLWIYTILSPLVFLGFAFPPIQKYTGKIWEDFIKQVIVGPLLAFFLWLALTTAGNSSTKIAGLTGQNSGDQLCGGLNSLFCETNFQKYIITIGLLMGGLMVTQSMGGAIAKAAGKATAWTKKAGVLAGAGVMFGAGYGARKFAAWDGKIGKFNTGLGGFEIRPTKIIQGIKEHLEETKIKDEMRVKDRGSELLGKGGLRGVLGGAGAGKDWASQYVAGFANYKGIKNIAHDVRWGTGAKKKLQDEYDAIQKKEVEPLEEQIKKYKKGVQTREEKDEKVKQLKDVDNRVNELSNKIKVTADDKEVKKMKSEMDNLTSTKDALEEGLKIPVESGFTQLERHRAERMLGEVRETRVKPIKEKIAKAQSPKAFEARAAYRTLVNSEKTKVKDVKNADELVMYYKDAERKGEKYKMAAIAERLYEDANGNELLNEYNVPSGGVGLHRFIQEKVVGPGYMSPREGLRLQSDLSETAEKVNHWDMAKTVGVNQFGELESLIKEIKDSSGKVTGYDDSKHAAAAAAEIFKMDPQGIMRSLNRLAFGGETPDGKGGREFNLSTLGKVLTKGLTQAFKDHGGRLLANTAFNLSKPHVIQQMKDIEVPNQTINIILDKGTQKGHTNDPGTVLAGLKTNQEHITKVKNI